MWIRSMIVLLLLDATLASAETFHARLESAPGVDATGTGTAILNLDATETEVTFHIEYSGLTGPELASHIHRPDGSIAFELPGGETKDGLWLNPGSINVQLLRSEQLYILIHTAQNLSGELRGDIRSGPIPTEARSWGAVKAMFDDLRIGLR
jgi:hypothetical protein